MGKIKRHTKKQVHRIRMQERKEKQADLKMQGRADERIESDRLKTESIFKGCDPARTLELIGEEW